MNRIEQLSPLGTFRQFSLAYGIAKSQGLVQANELKPSADLVYLAKKYKQQSHQLGGLGTLTMDTKKTREAFVAELEAYEREWIKEINESFISTTIDDDLADYQAITKAPGNNRQTSLKSIYERYRPKFRYVIAQVILFGLVALAFTAIATLAVTAILTALGNPITLFAIGGVSIASIMNTIASTTALGWFLIAPIPALITVASVSGLIASVAWHATYYRSNLEEFWRLPSYLTLNAKRLLKAEEGSTEHKYAQQQRLLDACYQESDLSSGHVKVITKTLVNPLRFIAAGLRYLHINLHQAFAKYPKVQQGINAVVRILITPLEIFTPVVDLVMYHVLMRSVWVIKGLVEWLRYKEHPVVDKASRTGAQSNTSTSKITQSMASTVIDAKRMKVAIERFVTALTNEFFGNNKCELSQVEWYKQMLSNYLDTDEFASINSVIEKFRETGLSEECLFSFAHFSVIENSIIQMYTPQELAAIDQPKRQAFIIALASNVAMKILCHFMNAEYTLETVQVYAKNLGAQTMINDLSLLNQLTMQAILKLDEHEFNQLSGMDLLGLFYSKLDGVRDQLYACTAPVSAAANRKDLNVTSTSTDPGPESIATPWGSTDKNAHQNEVSQVLYSYGVQQPLQKSAPPLVNQGALSTDPTEGKVNMMDRMKALNELSPEEQNTLISQAAAKGQIWNKVEQQTQQQQQQTADNVYADKGSLENSLWSVMAEGYSKIGNSSVTEDQIPSQNRFWQGNTDFTSFGGVDSYSESNGMNAESDQSGPR